MARRLTQQGFLDRCDPDHLAACDMSAVVYTGMANKITPRCLTCETVFPVRASNFAYAKSFRPGCSREAAMITLLTNRSIRRGLPPPPIFDVEALARLREISVSGEA